ncbi:MAG: hypothetical protein E7I65_07635, partial [Phocaeicola vulgatus]|nr:hypothetical protein [Phocaeicola vulgatus]
HGKMTIRMAYEMVMPYHLHMPSYFLETFTEYPNLDKQKNDRFHQRKRSLLTLKNKIVLLSQGE